MGAAKRRGSFEQRKEEARERIDRATAEMGEHLKKLEKMEAESEAKRNAVATQMVKSFMAHRENERLRRMGIRIGGGDGSPS